MKNFGNPDVTVRAEVHFAGFVVLHCKVLDGEHTDLKVSFPVANAIHDSLCDQVNSLIGEKLQGDLSYHQVGDKYIDKDDEECEFGKSGYSFENIILLNSSKVASAAPIDSGGLPIMPEEPEINDSSNEEV